MADQTRNPAAAGALLSLAIIAGAIGGVVAGQPTIGLLVGAAVGTALAIAFWLRDRKRVGR